MPRVFLLVLLVMLSTSPACRRHDGWKGKIQGEYSAVDGGFAESGSVMIFSTDFGNQIAFSINAITAGCPITFDDGTEKEREPEITIYRLKYPIECGLKKRSHEAPDRAKITDAHATVSTEGNFRMDLSYTIASTGEKKTMIFTGVKQFQWY